MRDHRRTRTNARTPGAQTLAASVLLAITPIAATTQDAAPLEWPQLRVETYELDLTPRFADRSLSATAVLHVVNRGAEPESDLPLLLNRLLRVTAVRGGDGRELEHTQAVVAFEDEPRLQVNLARVRLPRPLAAGDTTTVTVEYEGYLVGYTETGMTYVRDRIDPAFTILREDAFAYPMLGVPSGAARFRAGLSDFRYLARVTVPDTLVVANGGELVDRRGNDGVVTYTYRSIVPSWRIDIAIAPYEVLESDRTRVYYFPGDSAGAERVFRALTEVKDLYTAWFGPLHGPGAFAVIAIPPGWGSQTDVTAIIQSAEAFTNPAALPELYHEISHLWGVRSLDEVYSRWDEGLATYLQHRVAEVRDGGTPVAAWARATARWLQVRLDGRAPLRTVPMIDYGRHGMTDYSYHVGMLMFAALEERVGREALDGVVRAFYQRYHAAGATTEDLVRVAREVAGDGVDPVFERWLHTTRWADELDRWFP
jgi:hypothetical protein